VAKHVALTIDSKDHAVRFYKDILHAELVREFTISKDLVVDIFDIDHLTENILVLVFEVEHIQFEVFIVEQHRQPCFDHVCIAVDNVTAFITRCHESHLPVSIIPKGEKEIVFIKDFVGNLFEIKEK
jgi:catechol 2,3-dioxygenase-like lactoylglutathione lyase family enzyme